MWYALRKSFNAAVLPCAGLIILVLLPWQAVLASAYESILMPGKVIEGHKKYEKQCNRCHKKFNKKAQRTLCLDCHKKIAKDIRLKNGFHGRDTRIRKVQCAICHTEHKGRKADIVNLNIDIFSHTKTNFLLHGKHKSADCFACHTKGKKYRKVTSACVSCHKKQNPHPPSMGTDCQQCHTAKAWLNVRYDHSKTDFPLKGAHQTQRCSHCHKQSSYKNLPVTCISCHALRDVHQGALGNKCDQCHNSKKWKDIVFDHSKTDFPLSGKHKGLLCQSCHKKNPKNEKLPTTCIGCHKNDDAHKGRFGKKCNTCHDSESWSKSIFDHKKATGYALTNAHAKVACADCHKGNLYSTKTPMRCVSCHKKTDIHKGKLGNGCERCHNTKDWKSTKKIDHDLTRFPLIGQHSLLSCGQCHVTKQYRTGQFDCYSCHKTNDKHKGKLGTQCESCHNPNGWAVWQFDHNKDTAFKLIGAHKNLICTQCHTRASSGKKLKVSQSCGSCHAADDEHDGRFGLACGRCHNSKSFKEVDMKQYRKYR
jgi:hypothetical protein